MKELLESFNNFLNENTEEVLSALLSTIQQHTPTAKIKKQSAKSAHITDSGSRKNRQELLTFVEENANLPGLEIEAEVGQKTDGSASFRLNVIQDGTKIYWLQFSQGTLGKEGKPDSTKFEVNLVNALNAGKDCESTGTSAGEKFDQLAATVVSNIDSPVLADVCFMKLSARAQLSPVYRDQGTTSKEPKTDIISEDGAVRISVKKKGAQFISAQGSETAAVFLSAMVNPGLASDKFSQIIKDFFAHSKGYAAVRGQAPEDKMRIARVRQFLLNRILYFGGSELMDNIVREALLGENKFTNPEAIPNYFLVWDEDGSGELYSAEKFIKKVGGTAKLGIRGRGGTRGLSLRGEV